MEEYLKIFNDDFFNNNNYIFKKYKPFKIIDEGSFGNIYSVIRVKDRHLFAMKTEDINAQKKSLETEAYYLFTLQEGFGFPKLISFGHTKKYNILIETLLGNSLYNMFIKPNKVCNLIDVCLIGIQIIDRLEFIHSKDLVYRDIKPQNFLIGINDPNVIYIIDFGLSKKYRSSKTGKHILPKLTGKFNGTLLYISSNVLKGKESSRRDDLISLGYMLIYLLKRKLPWDSKIEYLNETAYNHLLYLRDTKYNDILFKDLPQEIIDYVNYSRSLKFEQDPNYSYLSSLFKKIIFKKNLDYKQLRFSWINPKDKKLLGLPKNKFLRKESPQIRILNIIKNRIENKISEKSVNINKLNIHKFDDKSIFYNLKNYSDRISENKINLNKIYSSNNFKKKYSNIISIKKQIKNNEDKNQFKYTKNNISNIKEYKNNIVNIKKNLNDLDSRFINLKNKERSVIRNTIFNFKTINNYNNINSFTRKTLNNFRKKEKKDLKNISNTNIKNKDNMFSYSNHYKSPLSKFNKIKKISNNKIIRSCNPSNLINYKVLNSKGLINYNNNNNEKKNIKKGTKSKNINHINSFQNITNEIFKFYLNNEKNYNYCFNNTHL